MKKEIILIGGGGHCKSCIDVIEKEELFKIAGIVEKPEKSNYSIFSYNILGSDENLPKLIKLYPYALISLGQIKSPVRRIQLFEYTKNIGFKFPSIQSPLAYVSPHAKVGEGTIVMHHAIINAGAKIGKNCIINTKTLIEHDAIIEDHCHIATGAIINGGVAVGRGSFFGSGAISKEYISISPNSFIRANSLVSENL